MNQWHPQYCLKRNTYYTLFLHCIRNVNFYVDLQVLSAVQNTKCSTFGAAGGDHRSIWDDLWAERSDSGLEIETRYRQKPRGLCLYGVAVVRPR